MKIIIAGMTGMKSRGGDALVTTICQQLRQRFPHAEIHLFTLTPAFDATRLSKEGVIVDHNVLHFMPGRLKARIKLSLSLVSNKIFPPISKARKLLRSANLVICTGGDIFSSDYGSFEPFLVPLREALHGGATVVQLALSIGPFKTTKEINLWRDVAIQCGLITTRELRSYEYITKNLNIPSDRVYHTADTAFLLEVPPKEVIKAMAQFYGLRNDRPTLALAPSHGVSMYSKSDYLQYLKVWSSIIDHASKKMGLQVLLIPHVQRDEVVEDDCILCTELVRRCDFDPSVHMASGDLTASELKGLISTCDLVVAERMHAAIAGLSSGRPTALIGYSVKAFGVAADFVGDEHVGGEHVIPVKDFLRDGYAIQWLEERWAARERTGETIRKHLPDVCARAMKNFDLIENLVKRFNLAKK
jgi:colanic acid/amylovoran biosynthesis protein